MRLLDDGHTSGGDSISWIFGYLVEFLLHGPQEIYRLNKQIKHGENSFSCVPVFGVLGHKVSLAHVPDRRSN